MFSFDKNGLISKQILKIYLQKVQIYRQNFIKTPWKTLMTCGHNIRRLIFDSHRQKARKMVFNIFIRK